MNEIDRRRQAEKDRQALERRVRGQLQKEDPDGTRRRQAIVFIAETLDVEACDQQADTLEVQAAKASAAVEEAQARLPDTNSPTSIRDLPSDMEMTKA